MKSHVAYQTKKNKISARAPAVASLRIAPKICQGQFQTIYSECPKFHPNPFNSGGVIAERVNIVEVRHKVCPILGEATASSPSNDLSSLFCVSPTLLDLHLQRSLFSVPRVTPQAPPIPHIVLLRHPHTLVSITAPLRQQYRSPYNVATRTNQTSVACCQSLVTRRLTDVVSD